MSGEASMKMSLEQAQKLTAELMQANIGLWHAIQDYCRANRIDLPEDEYSRRTDYYLHQVVGLIEEINGSPTKVKRRDDKKS